MVAMMRKMINDADDDWGRGGSQTFGLVFLECLGSLLLLETATADTLCHLPTSFVTTIFSTIIIFIITTIIITIVVVFVVVVVVSDVVIKRVDAAVMGEEGEFVRVRDDASRDVGVA